MALIILLSPNEYLNALLRSKMNVMCLMSFVDKFCFVLCTIYFQFLDTKKIEDSCIMHISLP